MQIDDRYQKALDLIEAHEMHKIFLRDEAIRLARERDEWRAAYEEAMRPMVIY